MLTETDKKLLSADFSRFPLMTATSWAVKQCGLCNHGNVNPSAMLLTAVTSYRKNPEFLKMVKQTIGLPAVVGGVVLKEISNE